MRALLGSSPRASQAVTQSRQAASSTGAPRQDEGSVTEEGASGEGRWENRPVLAGGVRAVAYVVPLVASVTAAWLLARALPTPTTTGARVLWWLAVAAFSLVALVSFDFLARRLLPLAALLRLSMVFPDRAPPRLGVALRTGSTRRLQERAVHDLKAGKQEPAAAARTILALAASLSAHDRGTRGHSERVRAYADLIAEELGLSRSDRDRLRWAALLHDLGKLSVPASTLNTHEALTEDDWDVLRRHPLEGARIAAPLREWLGPWATAIEQHHERYDGTGYPYGISGDQLTLAARIVAVADSYDAMTSVRSYSAAVAPPAARMELAKKAGTDFDPGVVRAFLNIGIGRLRWVMGPFAFLSALPFAPGLGGLRRVVNDTGRNVALGTASLVAVATVVHPMATPSPPAPSPPVRVLGQDRVRPPAATPPVAEVPVAAEAAPTPEPEAVAPVGGGGATAGGVAPRRAALAGPSSAAAIARSSGASTPGATATATTTTGAGAAATTNPPSAPAASGEPPAETATTPPASEPEPECFPNETSRDRADRCPPRWGHTEERPPHAGGTQEPVPRND